MIKPRARAAPMMCVLRNTLWLLGGQVEIAHTDIVLGEGAGRRRWRWEYDFQLRGAAFCTGMLLGRGCRLGQHPAGRSAALASPSRFHPPTTPLRPAPYLPSPSRQTTCGAWT